MNQYVVTLVFLGGIGIVCGIALGIASIYLYVKTDERVAKVKDMLPNLDCGACGYPGCLGMSKGLLKGEATMVQCRPSNQETKEKIAKYLKEMKENDKNNSAPSA